MAPGRRRFVLGDVGRDGAHDFVDVLFSAASPEQGN